MATIATLFCLLTVAVVPSPVDFDAQVIPILTKAGCNTGACHGAAVGRGGFRLSLYGGDPEFDHRSIAEELRGRRVNFADPDESLVIRKPTETMEHGGGYRMEYGGEETELLKRWINEGAKRIRSSRLERLEVTPASAVVETLDAPLALSAMAHFSDGSKRDVTRWTVFSPEDATAVQVDPKTAVAEIRRRGRHIVVARYLDQTVPVELLVPLSQTKIDFASEQGLNFIDEHALEMLATLRIPVAEQSGDQEFLRRLVLDLTGRLPSLEQQQRFQRDARSDKRQKWIEQLLDSEEFAEYWTLRLAKLLRIGSNPGDAQAVHVYQNWLRAQVSQGTPYNRLVEQLVVATGDSQQSGPPNFYRTVGGPREQAEFFSELFMGNRLRCANCHNHPLDRWTQDDYHGLAAVFAKLKRGRFIEVSSRGEVIHPRTGEAAVQKIPGAQMLSDVGDGRRALADWLTDADNPYFAKAIVNRIWKAMFGRGLVEPVDDLRATNPATHPKLLDALANDFVEHGFQLKHTVARIAASRTYQRSASFDGDIDLDNRFLSHAAVRPLEPEVLADAIADVSGVVDAFGEEPLGTRAVALIDPRVPSRTLDVLGRCSREDSCEQPGAEGGQGLTRQLHLFNGSLVNRRVADPNGRLAKWLSAGKSDKEMIIDFYQLALCRKPDQAELDFWMDEIDNGDAEKRKQRLEDFLWGLLTCREFVNNH